MKHRLSFLPSLLCGLLIAGAASAQQAYELDMERERAVGQRYQLQAQAQSSQTESQRVGAQVISESETVIAGRIVGVVEILEVSDAGKTRAIAIQIDQYTGTHSGEPVELDTTRRIILRSGDEDNTASYEGGEALSEEQTQIIDTVLTILIDGEDEPGDSDDALFNFDEPRRVGETWEANHAQLAQDFNEESPLVIDEDQIESTCRFIEIVDHHGEQAASVSVQITLGQIDLPELAQQGGEVTQSSGEVTMLGLLPLDRESNNGQIAVTMNMSMTAKVPLPENQGDLTLVFSTSQQAQAEYRLLDE